MITVGSDTTVGKLTPRPNDDAYRLYNEKLRTLHGGIRVTSLPVDTNARMIDVSNRSPSSALDQPFVSSVLFPYTSNLVPDCGVLRVLICSLS